MSHSKTRGRGRSVGRRAKWTRTAVRRSLARPMSMTVSAVRKGSIRAGPASNPSPRRMRPKCSQFLVGIDPGSGIDGAGEELSRARTAQPFEVLLVFDDRAECRLDRGLVELDLPQGDQ